MARTFLTPRFLLPALGLVGIAVVLSLLHRWQPENQVRIRFQAFLSEMGSRDWDDAGVFIDSSYSDRWGFTKEIVLRESREVLTHFLSVEIQAESPIVAVHGDSATVRGKIRLVGSASTPLGEMAKSEVNRLEEPFEFEWRRMSWKPWDWKLVQVNHPDLNPDQYGL
jgi:hypothetical protein